MCSACMSVTRMYLPCSFRLSTFRCAVMSNSRARRASEPSRVEELISVGKILLTKKGGDLLPQVTHTGQHGSSIQPTNFAKVKQIAVLHVDLVNQCLELAMIDAAGEDGADDLHHNHDVNEVGRLGVQSLLLVNDAAHLVYGLGVFTVAHQQRSGALLLPNHRWGTVGRHADKTGGIQEVLLHTLKHSVGTHRL